MKSTVLAGPHVERLNESLAAGLEGFIEFEKTNDWEKKIYHFFFF